MALPETAATAKHLRLEVDGVAGGGKYPAPALAMCRSSHVMVGVVVCVYAVAVAVAVAVAMLVADVVRLPAVVAAEAGGTAGGADVVGAVAARKTRPNRQPRA